MREQRLTARSITGVIVELQQAPLRSEYARSTARERVDHVGTIPVTKGESMRRTTLFLLAIVCAGLMILIWGCDEDDDADRYGEGDSDGDSDGDADLGACPADVHVEFLSEEGNNYSVSFSAEEVGCAYVDEAGGMSGTCVELSADNESFTMEFIYQIGGDDGDIGMFGCIDWETDDGMESYIGGGCEYQIADGNLSLHYQVPGLFVCAKEIPIATADCWWCAGSEY
jgi:hypothetical protein